MEVQVALLHSWLLLVQLEGGWEGEGGGRLEVLGEGQAIKRFLSQKGSCHLRQSRYVTTALMLHRVNY